MLAQFIAEFIGTFLFLLIILIKGEAIPIAIGLLASIYAFGGVSGGHFNPAVSVMMLANGTIDAGRAALYISAQVMGGLSALILYKNIIKA